VKKKSIAIVAAVVTLLLVAVYLRMDSPRRPVKNLSHAYCREFRGVRRVLRQIHGRAPAGTSSFPDLSNLSAGASAVEQLLQGNSTLRSGCWWCGSRYSRWTCVHQFIARSENPRPACRQFWDPQHLVAQELRRIAVENAGQRSPIVASAADSSGYAILYAPHSNWRQTPAAVFWNGPVVHVTSALEKTLHDRP